jgi:glycosyltransferase involved in cell wall biosynthesis
MTLLEAMSLSKPCIVTDAGGNKEIIENGETGFVTDNDNMIQFSDAMTCLGSQLNQISSFGDKAKLRFDNRFIASIMSKAYEQSYSE